MAAAGDRNDDNTYFDQQRYTSCGQGSSSTGRLDMALNSMSSSDCAISDSTSGFSYPLINNQLPNQIQTNSSPLCATRTSFSTFGDRKATEPSQQGSDSYAQFQGSQRGGSNVQNNQSYYATHSHASGLYAVQATQQQQQQRWPSRCSKPYQSPQAAAQILHAHSLKRQQNASVESSPATGTPSQMYDDRATRRCMSHSDMEKRPKQKQEEAARKLEKDQFTVEKQREEGKETKASCGAMSVEQHSADDDETEIRAMFQKMRELKAKNPAMLAKLWAEERRNHITSQSQIVIDNEPPAFSSQSTHQGPPKPTVVAVEGLNRSPALLSQSTTTLAKAAPHIATLNQPVPSQSTTISYLQGKMYSVALAMIFRLMELPENINKSIYKDDVVKILQSKPSYIQLCEELERLGLRFERSLLARELSKVYMNDLKSETQFSQSVVPLHPVNGTAAQVNGSATAGRGQRPTSENSTTLNSVSSTGAVANNTPIFMPFPDDAQAFTGMGKIYQSTIDLRCKQARPPSATSYSTLASQTDRYKRQLDLQPTAIQPEAKPEQLSRLSLNEETVARKRTFGNLVDLTAHNSDNTGPPKRIFITKERDAFMHPQLRTSESGQLQVRQPIIVQDICLDRNQQILRIPATSASQRVKTHLCGIATATSSTTVAPCTKALGPSQKQLQYERIKGKRLVEPIMRNRVARKRKYDSRTIARDVLLATGRHPDMEPLNAHLLPMAKLLSDHGGSSEGIANQSDLSTIRWDIIDPIPLKGDAVVISNTIPPAVAAADFADVEAPAPSSRVIGEQEVDSVDVIMNYVNEHDHVLGKAQPEERQDGPPHVSLPEQSTAQSFSIQTNGGGVRQHADSSAERPVPTGMPQSASTETKQAVAYAAFRHVDENSNPINKEGGPVGWRKANHSRGAASLRPTQSASIHNSKKVIEQTAKEIVEPKHRVYACRWRDCKAELHNLDTLKKHVIKMHGRPNNGGMLECQWQSCEAGPAGSNSSGKINVSEKAVAEWEDIHEWTEHVDKEHLQPVAWKLGDGPRGGLASTQFHAFSQTTPLPLSPTGHISPTRTGDLSHQL